MAQEDYIAARNHTRASMVETRQHTLLGIDLGEGAPRKPLVFGIAAFAIWVPVLWLILGAPNRITATLFILPPLLLAYFGAQKAPDNPRRFRFTTWVLALTYMLRGHRPIIGLGTREPTRAEMTPWSQRRDLPTMGEVVRPWTRRPAWERATSDAPAVLNSGPDVRLRARARLLGNGHVAGILQRRARTKRGKKK